MCGMIAVLFRDNIYHGKLEEGEKITFGSGKNDTVQIAELEKEQITVQWKKNGIFAASRKPYYAKSQMIEPEQIVSFGSEEELRLFFSMNTEEAEQQVAIPYNSIIRIGRNTDSYQKNNIDIQNRYVSREHMVIQSEGGVIRVKNLSQTNGTYLNGKKVVQERLRSGDVLSILTIQISLLNGALVFKNTGGQILIHEITGDLENHNVSVGGGIHAPKFHRSPRTQKELPVEPVILAQPPAKGAKFEKRKGMFASLFGQGAMTAASLAMGAVSPAFLVARTAGMITPIVHMGSYAGDNKKRKKQLEEYERMRQEKYGVYIEGQRARIESVAKEQREILKGENPSAEECLEIVRKVDRNLWERACGERDFLDVRLGMGYEPLCVEVKSFQKEDGFQMEQDEVQQIVEEIIEETRMVDFVPARLKLTSYSTIGLIGRREKVIHLVRNMVVCLTTAHLYKDVKLVGIFGEDEKEQWQAMRWLPHVWDNEKQSRFMAFGKKEAHELCEKMNDMLESRIRSLENEQGEKVKAFSPKYLFILGSREVIQDEIILKNLLRNRSELGITALFLFNEMYDLPSECQYLIDMDGDPSMYEKDKVNRKIFFTVDREITLLEFDRFTRSMSAILLEGFAEQADVPDGVTFLQGYQIQNVRELNVLERWKNSRPYESLAAPIGAMAGGKVLSLDIHEDDKKGHGPHGLVAGTSGSGKSELLLTWILSMAVNYHPHEVNFVLIDYKGGGMANLLDALPHVVGKVTDIGSNIRRSLISLQSENKRRERIFEECGKKYGVKIKDIYDYQKLYRDGVLSVPLPHLIIVVDEFAELKKEQPEFMQGLKSVSLVGRSLGMHLVLATQKPSGVVDEQIWSNARFKLCLKVLDAADSREMLHTPDAARITRAGRGYMLVGNGERYELFQSYWSGAPYFGDARSRQDSQNRIRVVTMDGMRLKTAVEEKTRFESEIDELGAAVRYIANVVKAVGIQKLTGPWLPELPHYVVVSSLRKATGYQDGVWSASEKWLRIPIGLYDDPARQKQGVQYLNLTESGHTGIYGSPSTGKTTLLKTILMSTALNFSPEEVQIYVIDCGSWTTGVFEQLPHVGGIVLGEESEKMVKLEAMLWEELKYRKTVFLQNHVGSLETYRSSVAQDIPAWILAIDNLAAMFKLYPDLEELFVTLVQSGANYGIYVIYTGNSSSDVKWKLQQSMKNAITFELADPGDYAGLVGRLNGRGISRADGKVIAGRALAKGNPPMEFQAAVYADGKNEMERNAALKTLILEMNQSWKGKRPKSIPVMPAVVMQEEIAAAFAERQLVPLGRAYSDIEICYADMWEKYVFVVSGMMKTGKSRFLEKTAEVMHQKFRESCRLYVFDGTQASLKPLAGYAHRYCMYHQLPEMDEIMREIIEMLNSRKKAQNQARLLASSGFDERKFIQPYEQICIFIDDIKEFVDLVSNENLTSMERICRLAQGLGVSVFAAGRVTDLNKYSMIESLTRVLVGYQQGLLLSGSAAMCNFFDTDLPYNEKSVELKSEDAYFMLDGACQKIRLADEGNR